jgi:dCTP deaminase
MTQKNREFLSFEHNRPLKAYRAIEKQQFSCFSASFCSANQRGQYRSSYGNVALMVRARGSSHVDPAEWKRRATAGDPLGEEFYRQQKHERFEIPFHNRILLHPGSLALVPALEWLKVPNDLLGSVTARSTWAREGLSIATATLIEPGYRGVITLELANLGEIPLALYPGQRIAQITFAAVDGDTRRTGRPQFEMSFEPVQGRIAAEDDFVFLPDQPTDSS